MIIGRTNYTADSCRIAIYVRSQIMEHMFHIVSVSFGKGSLIPFSTAKRSVGNVHSCDRGLAPALRPAPLPHRSTPTPPHRSVPSPSAVGRPPRRQSAPSPAPPSAPLLRARRRRSTPPCRGDAAAAPPSHAPPIHDCPREISRRGGRGAIVPGVPSSPIPSSTKTTTSTSFAGASIWAQLLLPRLPPPPGVSVSQGRRCRPRGALPASPRPKASSPEVTIDNRPRPSSECSKFQQGDSFGRCCGRAEEGRRVPAQLRGRPPPHLLPEQDGGEGWMGFPKKLGMPD
ncbi:hypothetical protein PVAP13_4KG094000 [Panicum virgatum]|uniref:Uncharacterized protein n=1 Tax=Panicum virgatum TaxID=38727 RepID=A0A8T0TLS9_PANVG|nr:hypothetical protein PVAP13_4KG094000 [Panicum virgatum]